MFLKRSILFSITSCTETDVKIGHLIRILQICKNLCFRAKCYMNIKGAHFCFKCEHRLFFILAAITAIRARSIVPNRPAPMRPQLNLRSVIPKPVASTVIKTAPSVYNNGLSLVSRQITVNGIEKSGIPRPQYQPAYPRGAVPKSLVKPIGEILVILA